MSNKETNNQDRSLRSAHKRRNGACGFSLIELLVVIAIIALLAAVIYPVFSKVKEDGQRHVAISNMDRIQTAAQRYAADHGGDYPPVLYAYSDGTSSMGGIGAVTNNTGACQTLNGGTCLAGIFPTYLSDAHAFTDPDNPVNDIASTKSHNLNDNTLGTTGTLTASTHQYFDADAYDSGPLVISAINVNPSVLVPRYQRAWTSVVNPTTFTVAGTPAFSSTPVGTQGITYTQYLRQMDLPSSTGDTYVTCDTYHVRSSGFVEVLFKDGHVGSFDPNRLLQAGGGADISNISVNSSATPPQVVSPSRTWMLTPTGLAQ
ncbi:MAG: type II secretion system protein [Capsulimonadaceae bacterium]